MELELLYVEFAVSDYESIDTYIGRQLTFKLCAERENNHVKQSLWQQGKLRFVTTTFKCDPQANQFNDDYVVPFDITFNKPNGDSSFRRTKNYGTAYNVAFRVHDIKLYIDHIQKNGGELLKPIKVISDSDGFIQVAVIKSCIGNVVHTLVEFTNYNGLFMPQFEAVGDGDDKHKHLAEVSYVGIDHLAFAINIGHSQDVMDWYQRCFQMQRYYVHRLDTKNEGFKVEFEDVGVRLAAMTVEAGLRTHDSSMKIVLAESLHANSSDQISTFLTQHRSEGLQHIGLTTHNIAECIAVLTHNGVLFTEPPPTYYSEIGKLSEIEYMGENAQLMEEHGILIDGDDVSPNGYLMQKFTKPLFDLDTFFFEIIQRKGARGFGAGNVSALWRSFKAYLEQMNEAQSHHT